MTTSHSHRTSSSCLKTISCSFSRVLTRRQRMVSASDACCTLRPGAVRWRSRAWGAPASSRALWWNLSRPTSCRSSRAPSVLLQLLPPAPPHPSLRGRPDSKTHSPSGWLSCNEPNRAAAKENLTVCSSIMYKYNVRRVSKLLCIYGIKELKFSTSRMVCHLCNQTAGSSNLKV